MAAGIEGARSWLLSLPGALGKSASFPLGWAILLIIVGFAALALPFEAGIAIAILVASFVIVAGIAHIAGTFAARTTAGYFWGLLVGAAYLFAGVYLVLHPKLSLVSLTLALAALFLVEGIFRIVSYFHVRSAPGAGWILFRRYRDFGPGHHDLEKAGRPARHGPLARLSASIY